MAESPVQTDVDGPAPGRGVLPRIEQMVHAVERAARRQSELADRLMAQGDYGAEIPAADGEALFAAAELIKQVGCVTPALDDQAFRSKVEGMDLVELRRRVLAQAGHVRAYARSLDGMGVEIGVEGCRDADDVREAYRRTRAFVQAPPFLDARQLASVCFSINHGFGLMSERDQDAMRVAVSEWYRALIKELREPSLHPLVVASADRYTERLFLGDDDSVSLTQEAPVAVCPDHDRECSAVTAARRCAECPFGKTKADGAIRLPQELEDP